MGTGDKLLCGLIGTGIQRSLTPAMQEEEARQHGLRLHYQLIDLPPQPDATDRLAPLLDAVRLIGFRGLNVTYPFKQAVLPLLDALSPEAQAIGAVNTVSVDGSGRLTGHNTDASGWAWGLRRHLPDADLGNVVLLGAGGAGSAIAHALLRLGAASLRIVDTDAGRAQALATALRAHHDAPVGAGTDVADALRGATGLVHATPSGTDMHPGLPLPASLLRPPLWVSEIVYFPIDTDLLRAARAAGCRTVDGGAMAVGQAVGAFRHFTGRDADTERVESHFKRLLDLRRREDA